MVSSGVPFGCRCTAPCLLFHTDLQQRDPDTFKPLHVVSMTIRDSADDSAAAAGDVLDLCKMLEDCDDLDSDAAKLLNDFRIRSKRTVLHQVCHI
ncbi:similar to Ssu72-like protein [Ectocarpus siliculosus]|uniref:RNA polymerase II subunit A C-terminal domain phosphatase SSU72 n=1 Tax=Ectocarpus siliculosus TaxID=2880 RepID=D8LTB6_ECTSI|nr:similar to Ssu72-like protein [Ectocarpus siliculosus]|eukprot:CBN77987.1 similar to Ssu72-like protein [Ectocarpus siliculosus]